MSMPNRIASYVKEWGNIAQRLTEGESLTIPFRNVKAAKAMRLRFYGFRNALAKHDKGNPWVTAVFETQATITPEGNLHLEREPYAAILRDLLGQATVTSKIEPHPDLVKAKLAAQQPPEREPYVSEGEKTITELLYGKKNK